VLFGKRRAYQRKCAKAEFDGVCSGDIYVFESGAPDRLDPSYLPHLCQTDAFFGHAIGTSAGSLSPRTNWSSLAKFRFTLPFLDEQARIVSILEPLDYAQASAREALAAGRAAFETLTWRATTGALGSGPRVPVVGWRYGRLPGVDDLPAAWELVTLTEVARLESGHTPSKRRDDYWNGGIPWISLADIQRLGEPEIYDTEMEISSKGLANSSARLLPRGTVVLSRDASIGFTSVMAREMATSQHYAHFVCDEGRLLPSFLYYLFRAMHEYFNYIAIGSTNVKTIYMPFFKRMQIPLPPLEEQREVIALLSETWEGLVALERRVEQHAELLRAVREDLIGRHAS
jgi:type I restriction enzyme S subunit